MSEVNGNYAPWPESGLESVTTCPVCDSNRRRLLHATLTDRTFFCAPGEWNLHECLYCGSAYLDPRPTEDSIHLAYEQYYTHTQPGPLDTSASGALSRVRHALGNGYRNWRFGTQSHPATKLGIFAAWVSPKKRKILEQQYRNLPLPPVGGRLLDVGFGNAAFLELARSAGWLVAGVDPDPVTVESARKRGLNVQLGHIDAFSEMQETFDVITLSHVIEHAHKPRDLIVAISRLLKPGGRVWIETPNIDSFGHWRFGRHWRGLEAPRHLVLFNWRTLESTLKSAGLNKIRRLARRDLYAELAAKSSAMKQGRKPSERQASTIADVAENLLFGTASKLNYRRSEYITLVAFKAGTL